MQDISRDKKKAGIFSQPWFVLLLPVFFVLHNYQEFYGLLDFYEAAHLLPSYIIKSVLTFIVLFIVMRSTGKAALLTFIILGGYYFFSAFHQRLTVYFPDHFFSRYRVALLLVLVVSGAGFVLLAKSRNRIAKFFFFINVLLLVFIVTDILFLFLKPGQKPQATDFFSDDVRTDTFAPMARNLNPADVYLLVFDEYASSSSLRKLYSFENNLDTFLTNRNFKVPANASSNYNFTPFSITSLFNMAYLRKEKGSYINRDDYAAFHYFVKNNKVGKLFSRQGYKIYNFSSFDFLNQRSIIEQPLLPIKSHLIYYQTFFVYSQPYLGEWLNAKFGFLGKWLFPPVDAYYKPMNDQLFNSTLAVAAKKDTFPKFVYMHVFMPHRPWLPDQDDIRKVNERYRTNNKYLAYVYTANKKIFKLVDCIKESNPNSVIILLGDHGLRYVDTLPGSKAAFENMNAIYFPSGNYRNVPDSLTPVNEFRLISNELFKTNFPMLKDSIFEFEERGRTLR